MAHVSTMMKAPKRTYPSFTYVLTHESYPMCASTFDVAYIRPSKKFKTCRAMDLEDPLMRTEGGRYDDTRNDDYSDALASLEDAISAKTEVNEGRMSLGRRRSLSTLVIDLALTVTRSIQRLRAISRENELEFAMVTP